MFEPGTHRRIALLICDVPVDTIREQHGDYTRIFGTLLEESLKPINETHSADSQTTFTLEPFDVRAQIYPNEDEYDAILITGSGAWKQIHICHECEPCSRHLQLTELGKRVYGVESGVLNIHLMNRDHVPTEPPSFYVLASSSQSPNHGMVLFSQSESSKDISHSNFRLTDIHILTSQGHPEFTESITRILLSWRRELLGPELVHDGESRAGNQNDGIAVIGKAIWGVMGVD
ncbi:hypothetical protein EDD22DRAFT_880416 [Suillus occidentalis]|nr:hypothetical protein EDD22DRAFT_880416 [Suillus occidentalis]